MEAGRTLTHGCLRQAVAAIGNRHTVAGQPDPTGDPTIAVLLEGYGRIYGTAATGKDPIRGTQLGAICLTLSQPATTATRDLAPTPLATDGALGLGPGQVASLDRANVQLPAGPLGPSSFSSPDGPGSNRPPSNVASPRIDATERLTVAVALGQPSDDDVRDRAILTALYWGCFRGEELASTRRHQLRLVDRGIEWTPPRAKNDQHGQGHTRGVP